MTPDQIEMLAKSAAFLMAAAGWYLALSGFVKLMRFFFGGDE